MMTQMTRSTWLIMRSTWLITIGVIIMSLCFLLQTGALNMECLLAVSGVTMGQTSAMLKNTSHTDGFTFPSVLYGHIHMAKTAGTEINGELATHFERICGHKGYSYDALAFNHRIEEYSKHNSAKSNGTATMTQVSKALENDLINLKHPGFNRGRVPGGIMGEIGFHDCDWISFEASWKSWVTVAAFAATIPLKLELHVPCRDPLSHLMSQCNHLGKKIDCTSTNIVAEVKKCLMEMGRYNDTLKQLENVHLKCFNPIPIDSYVDYMSGILQPRRISTKYVHRETNRPRNKDKECIWKNPKVAEEVNAILLKIPYYRFCDECMGSHNDLLI